MKNWAVILGASSGIGLECALRLAKNGINIYGIYLRKKNSEVDVIKKKISEYGVNVVFKKANASNDDMRNQIIEELKNIDNINCQFLIHSIAFGTLKKMIDESINKLAE